MLSCQDVGEGVSIEWPLGLSIAQRVTRSCFQTIASKVSESRFYSHFRLEFINWDKDGHKRTLEASKQESTTHSHDKKQHYVEQS